VFQVGDVLSQEGREVKLLLCGLGLVLAGLLPAVCQPEVDQIALKLLLVGCLHLRLLSLLLLLLLVKDAQSLLQNFLLLV